MSDSIPYKIADPLSAAFNWPNKFYWSLFDVLIRYDTQGIALGLCRLEDDISQGREKFTPISPYFVFKHLIFRTIQFQKIFEFVKRKDVIEGFALSAVAGCNLSEATVKRVLTELSPPYGKYFVKLRLIQNRQRIITPVFGLNLPAILQVIYSQWHRRSTQEQEDRPERKPSNNMLRGFCLLNNCIEFALPYKTAFHYLLKQTKPIENVERLAKRVEARCPDSKTRTGLVADFENGLEKCKEIEELRKSYNEGKKKQATKCMTAKTLRQKMVELCNEYEVTYYDSGFTKRDFGSAKTFINHCAKLNKNPVEELRLAIRLWSHFRLDLRADDDKSIMLPETVSFRKFFQYRNEIGSWIAVNKDRADEMAERFAEYDTGEVINLRR